MKITLSWLLDYLDTDKNLEEICEALVSLGLEVEGVIDQGRKLSDFKVAYIKSIKKHPDSSNLNVCEVDDGSNILQIVCGAKNAREGIYVVLAPIGTLIPSNNLIIKPIKIRNVESNGMLCSLEELGLENESDGIIELENNPIIGDKVAKYLGQDEVIIEISITPNRGDCFGIYGIARDLAAKKIGKLKKLEFTKRESVINSPIKVDIKNDNCKKYLGMYFSDVKNGESPDWLKKRLIAIGQKPISTLVDITNYITIAFGRPLHIYDASKINGDIKVREALEHEKFTALNDKEYLLNKELVIADDEKIIGLAGIIGESTSGCNLHTKDIWLEIALFNEEKIAQDGRKHQLTTEARTRFERGVDAEFLMKAKDIASEMIVNLCSGNPHKFVIEGNYKFQQVKINFDLEYFKKLSGYEVKKEEAKNILQDLGCEIREKETLEIIVPSWRSDLKIKEDLVEEIMRIKGYDKIEMHKLPEINLLSSISGNKKRLLNIKRMLSAKGYYETISFGFTNSKIAKEYNEIDQDLLLTNPISSELDYMRPSILPNQLITILNNINRNIKSFSIFEIGNVFSTKDKFNQKLQIAGTKFGIKQEKTPFGDSCFYDFYDIKEDVLQIIESLGVSTENIQLDIKDLPNYYHPGKACNIKLGKNILASLGEIHPSISNKYDINLPMYQFEIYPENFPSLKEKRGKRGVPNYSDFQIVERDFAFLVEKDVLAYEVKKTIKSCNKDLIKEVRIFDVYEGSKISEGKKSIALSVKLQSMNETLNDAMLDIVTNDIINKVRSRYNAELRS